MRHGDLFEIRVQRQRAECAGYVDNFLFAVAAVGAEEREEGAGDAGDGQHVRVEGGSEGSGGEVVWGGVGLGVVGTLAHDSGVIEEHIEVPVGSEDGAGGVYGGGNAGFGEDVQADVVGAAVGGLDLLGEGRRGLRAAGRSEDKAEG